MNDSCLNCIIRWYQIVSTALEPHVTDRWGVYWCIHVLCGPATQTYLGLVLLQKSIHDGCHKGAHFTRHRFSLHIHKKTSQWYWPHPPPQHLYLIFPCVLVAIRDLSALRGSAEVTTPGRGSFLAIRAQFASPRCTCNVRCVCVCARSQEHITSRYTAAEANNSRLALSSYGYFCVTCKVHTRLPEVTSNCQ